MNPGEQLPPRARPARHPVAIAMRRTGESHPRDSSTAREERDTITDLLDALLDPDEVVFPENETADSVGFGSFRRGAEHGCGKAAAEIRRRTDA